MSYLTSGQRSVLESAVKKARKVAETGARNALQTLAVNSPEAYAHMSSEQRSLRNRLRSKGRLLGDELSTGGPQEIKHLSTELAYDYWHKMLFASFLESNNLLIHSSGVPVSLEECEEFAKSEGYSDKWTAASHFASAMLPAIFRTQDPLMQVEFATEDRIKLEAILDEIESPIFEAKDSLGWVYQFWQSEAKDTINKSGDKIDSEKLPAVTQLFTEPYMVHFLIDNTIGAWWISRHLGQNLTFDFPYLRLLEDGTPSAGRFESWPETAAEITVLDPCMGSGHFIVSVFQVLIRLRMFEENLSETEATDKVISENLHGLEIDPRCTQIAAFNLALTAWKFCGKYRKLPEMNIACCGIAPLGRIDEWIKLVDNIPDPVQKSRMKNGIQSLYHHFQLAPELGSLLDPSAIKADAFTASFEELQQVLIKALEGETDKERVERGVVAAGIAKVGEILSQKYILQITNVPYLGQGKMDSVLAEHVQKNYINSKADLATVFLDRLLKISTKGGSICIVTPQNWLFLTYYKKFREKLLKNQSWHFVARLGSGAFSQISGEVVKAILFAISNNKPNSTHVFSGIDVSEGTSAASKENDLKTVDLINIKQLEQLKNPGIAIVFTSKKKDNEVRLSKLVDFHKGICTGDRNRFIRNFFEVLNLEDWKPFRSSSNHPENPYSGVSEIIYWQDGDGDLEEFLHQRLGENISVWLRGEDAWNKRGIAIARVSTKNVVIYGGELFDDNISVFTPLKKEDIAPLYSFVKSDEFYEKIKAINQKLSIDNEYFSGVHIDLKEWLDESKKSYPSGIPFIQIDFPDEFYFHGNPGKAEAQLQVATARLLGYHWPAENDNEMELAEETKALINSIKPFDYIADDDGIICIPSVNNETSASERLREYLQVVLGDLYNNNTIAQFLEKEGSKKNSLEDWLRDEFFDQHCKIFQNRPFIWHIWDGRKDGFGALVNYHKLTKENLRKLIYTYLGDWIRQCEFKNKKGESGSEGLLTAALKLKEKLEKILEGENPFDIFIRWKPIEKQPIGWDPDLNDGVRLNIRPFITADVLRKKPNIKWGIDRGKNPKGSPWGEIRDNDRHLSLEEKRKAKEK